MTKMKHEVKARKDCLQKQIAALRKRHSGMVAAELRNIEEQEQDNASWADPSWVAASLLNLSSPVDFHPVALGHHHPQLLRMVSVKVLQDLL